MVSSASATVGLDRLNHRVENVSEQVQVLAWYPLVSGEHPHQGLCVIAGKAGARRLDCADGNGQSYNVAQSALRSKAHVERTTLMF